MALIPPFFLDCVVSIGTANQKQTKWFGTGFIVGRPINDDSGNKVYHTFIVTNRHILNNKSDVVLRFNSLQGAQVLDYPISLAKNGQSIWVGYGNKEVDIAAFFINPKILKKDDAQFSYFALDEHIMTIEEMKANGVSEGDGIFVLGFPLGIVAPQSKHVIVRTGAIARIRDVLENKQSSFMIDANIFPGNSGGPVVIRPEFTAIQGTKAIKKAALIGIVKQYVPYQDVAISQQTGNPRVIFEENSGLALVETVNNIKALIDECYQKKLATQPLTTGSS